MSTFRRGKIRGPHEDIPGIANFKDANAADITQFRHRVSIFIGMIRHDKNSLV